MDTAIMISKYTFFIRLEISVDQRTKLKEQESYSKVATVENTNTNRSQSCGIF